MFYVIIDLGGDKMTTVNKQELIRLLMAYEPYESLDEISKRRTLEFLSSNEQVFGSDNPLGHITASSWLINFSGDSVLLTHHSKLNLWLQLGGHTEPYESILESAMRETKEESGLEALTLLSSNIFDVDVHEIPERKTQGAHFHYDVRFLIRQTKDEAIAISDESNDLKWVKHEEVFGLTNQRSVIRMVEKYLKLNER